MPDDHQPATRPMSDADRLRVYQFVAVLALVVIAATFPDPAVRLAAGAIAVGVALGELLRDRARPLRAAASRAWAGRPSRTRPGSHGRRTAHLGAFDAAEARGLLLAADEDDVAWAHRQEIAAFVRALDALPTAERR